MAFNPGVEVPVICRTTQYEDYTAGEVGLEQMPGRSRRAGGGSNATATERNTTFSRSWETWCGGDKPQLPDAVVIDYVRRLSAVHAVVTFDVPILPGGLIPEPFVA